ncbi:MAG TPA: TetR/AcrR family transcriptional regulator [Sedimentisphaerales bacterium]|nr:TetR/AcrR family transcriptional regulator [Sedimentisphaerales bacterium]
MAETTRPSRRQRERQRHRDEIVEAAMRLFSEKGFHNVSMQEIAAEAEFATGTIYNFFDSKETLYREIMNEVADNVLSVVQPILEGGADEKEKLAGFIRASIRVFRENSAAIRLFLRANQGPLTHIGTAHFSETAGKVHDTLQARLRQVYAAGVRRGTFRALDPRVVSLALDAALRAIVFSVAEDTEESALEQRVAHIEELFFRGILNG